MDAVSVLLASPRGRFFSAKVGYMCSDDERASHHRRPRSSDDVLDVLEAVDVRAIARLSEIELLDALALAVDFARYWQPPDAEDLMFARPEIVAALRPIARAALASPHARWWAEPVDLGRQRLVQDLDPRWGQTDWPLEHHRPDDDLAQWRARALATEARFLREQIADPDSDVAGYWWSTPEPSCTLATTRARDGLGALELILEEDSFGSRHARVWPARIHGTPRIYEITDPAAWVRLVDTYPFPVPASRRSVWFEATGTHDNWFIPDWAAVAADYDAVHLTMIGYLTTPGIAIPLAARAGATVLAGWDPDATFWLGNDLITIDNDPADWHLAPDGPTEWRRTEP
ncbi:hypothetical protein [Rhodococcus oryzae]|uniref:hypothetical protein n=1 Tax=Rhodococcus oryzae TaxID=2571143 RepID=UPI00379C39E3